MKPLFVPPTPFLRKFRLLMLTVFGIGICVFIVLDIQNFLKWHSRGLPDYGVLGEICASLIVLAISVLYIRIDLSALRNRENENENGK